MFETVAILNLSFPMWNLIILNWFGVIRLKDHIGSLELYYIFHKNDVHYNKFADCLHQVRLYCMFCVNCNSDLTFIIWIFIWNVLYMKHPSSVLICDRLKKLYQRHAFLDFCGKKRFQKGFSAETRQHGSLSCWLFSWICDCGLKGPYSRKKFYLDMSRFVDMSPLWYSRKRSLGRHV